MKHFASTLTRQICGWVLLACGVSLNIQNSSAQTHLCSDLSLYLGQSKKFVQKETAEYYVIKDENSNGVNNYMVDMCQSVNDKYYKLCSKCSTAAFFFEGGVCTQINVEYNVAANDGQRSIMNHVMSELGGELYFTESNLNGDKSVYFQKPTIDGGRIVFTLSENPEAPRPSGNVVYILYINKYRS